MSPVHPRVWTHSPSRREGIGNRYTLAGIHVPLGAFACEMMNMLVRELGSLVSTRLGGTQLVLAKLGCVISPLPSGYLFCLCSTQGSVRTQRIFSVNKYVHLHHWSQWDIKETRTHPCFKTNVATASGMFSSEALTYLFCCIVSCWCLKCTKTVKK